jgi:hypothetical protein
MAKSSQGTTAGSVAELGGVPEGRADLLALSQSHVDRLELSVPVPRHLDLDRPDLGVHRLGPGAIAGVLPLRPAS